MADHTSRERFARRKRGGFIVHCIDCVAFALPPTDQADRRIHTRNGTSVPDGSVAAVIIARLILAPTGL